jgi:uncharacterized protein YkwD
VKIKYASVVFLATAFVLVLAVGGLALAQEAADALVPVETCTGETVELTDDEKRTLDLHNQTRADNGLSALCVHPALTEAARAHSQEMVGEGYFGHESRDGAAMEDRIERFGYSSAGYSYWAIGENVGWGTGPLSAPESRFEEWMDSPDHWPNILSESFTEVGIGVHDSGTHDEGKMYTVDFGTRY